MSGSRKDERPPVIRYVASEDSLKKAAFLAERLGLGLEMDRDTTVTRARDLHALYFADIRTLIPEYCAEIQFEDLAGHSIEVCISHTDNGPRLRFDQHFSMWHFSLNLITVIFSFYRLPSDDMQILGELLEDRLRQWHHPMDHQELREREWPWHARFPDVQPLAHALTIAMDVYTICHELAHAHLGHLDQKHVDHALELEADRLGYELFQTIQNNGEHITHARLDAKLLAAPCLSLGYIDLLERWSAKQSGKSEIADSASHPKALVRRQALMDRYAAKWPADAQELYRELNYSIEDFARGLGITEIKS